NAKDFNKSDNDFAQNNLRILSGLYGILKPNDLILPYRLEMGTKLKTIKENNLYRFWQDKLHQNIGEELNNEVLINLASNEYSKVLKLNKLKSEVITPVFKDYKNGKLKVISFFAKKARGEMCNFIIKNKINSIEEIKQFNRNNYNFSEEESTVNNLVFIR
ncbi:MAG: peroxide stress protein YaaA, partial [Flavobacteriales bacterium]|nr:peroxide stress protein YaaA [Flavobacteriales bacterium]